MIRRPLAVLAAASLAAALAGCPKEEPKATDAGASPAAADAGASSTTTTTTTTTTAAEGGTMPAAGQPLDMSHFKDFPMGMTVGSKRTYTMTTAVAGQKQAMEMAMEVVAVKGDVATVKTTTMGQTTTQEIPIAGAALGQAQAADKAGVTITSGGTEDVTVPAGTYPGAVKFVATTKDGARVTSWVARDVGLVKSETEATAAGMKSSSTMELKAFKK